MSTDQFNIKSRALGMFRTGQRADCVIEVVSQRDGQDPEKRVCFFYCTLLGYATWLYDKNTKVSIEEVDRAHPKTIKSPIIRHKQHAKRVA
jgi:hypothetical protein